VYDIVKNEEAKAERKARVAALRGKLFKD